MANMAEIYDAIRAADAAGDGAAVQRLSEYIQSANIEQGTAPITAPETAPLTAPITPTVQAPDLGPDVAPKEQTPGLGEKLGKRLSGYQEYVQEKSGGNLGKFAFEAPTIAAVAAGQIAGGIGDIAATGLEKVYEAVAPEDVKSLLKDVATDLMQTPVGKLGLAALEKGGELYSSYKDAHPEAAMELESAVNLALFGGGGKVAKETGAMAKGAVKEATGIATDVARLAAGEAAPKVLTNQLETVVKKNVWNMIRPSVFSKKAPSQIKSYLGDVTEAVKTIVRNKDNLGLVDEFGKQVNRLPENLWELSAAVENTKKAVYRQYDDMAKAAGSKPVNVDNVVGELARISADPDVRLLNKSAVKSAEEISKSLIETPRTAEGIQKLIKELNVKLKPFYRNPTPGEAHKAAIYEATVTRLRKALDNHITALEGPGYKQLKGQYKALKAIEDEVGHRAIISARANKKGLMDFTDFYSGAQIMESLATGSPIAAAKGATVKGIQSIYKRLNDPNRFVKIMFKQADKIVKKMDGFQPKSKLGGVVKGKVTSLKSDMAKLERLKAKTGPLD